MREIALDEIKAIQLEITNDVVHFCDNHNIRYSLAYGTLIGAIRHRGYIPWDDDIDLFMPRPDYDRFVSSYSSAENYLVDLSTQETCIEMFCKICRNDTVMEDITNNRRLWGICIDIFPIDGIPSDNPSAYYNNALRKWNRLPKVCPFYKGVSRQKVKWLVKYLIKKLCYCYLGDILSMKKDLTSTLKNGDYPHSKLAGCYFGDAGMQEFMEKEVFENYCKVTFEGNLYSAPTLYDKYLTALYGNYMQLPPPEKRITHHAYHYYIID